MSDLFGGLPLWAQILFWIALTVALVNAALVLALWVASRRFARRVGRWGTPPREFGGPGLEADFLWVFLVPALNEQVTIADSIGRLRESEARNAVFVVIDDGSDDDTAMILARMTDSRLRVLSRRAPDARRGKAAALNAGYRYIREVVLREPEYADWPDERVVVVVVDADGRLHPKAPEAVARHLLDGGVGGVQTLVRIYNRRSLLTWAQDLEFSAFGLLFQAGRAWWGTANLGGNGQFTRLSALNDVSEGDGPWRDRLAEDQDLGVRLIQAGWANVQENSVTISQQGLNSLRRLYRQRVRWAQGNWQSFSLLGGAGRVRAPWIGRVDAYAYLLTPLLQLLVGVAFVTSLVLWAGRDVPYSPDGWWVLVFFFAIAFGPGVIAIALRGGRWWSVFTGLVLVWPYTVYSWLVFPVLAVALVRQLSGRTGWAKTARERVDAPAERAPDSTSRVVVLEASGATSR